MQNADNPAFLFDEIQLTLDGLKKLPVHVNQDQQDVLSEISEKINQIKKHSESVLQQEKRKKFLFAFIAETASEINRCKTVEEIYNKIHERLTFLMNNQIVITSSHEWSDNTIGIIRFSKLENKLKKIEKIAGLSIYKRIPYDMFRKNNPEVDLKDSKLLLLRNGLYDFSAHQIGKLASKSIEAMLDIHYVYLIGFVWDEKLHGGVAFLCDTPIDLELAYAIETVVMNAAILMNNKRIEMQLKQTGEDYFRLINNSNEGIWLVDKNFNTTFVNPALCRTLGFNSLEMAGQNVMNFIGDEFLNSHLEHISDRRNGVSSSYEVCYKAKSGEEKWFYQTVVPLYDKGLFNGAFAMLTEITQKRNAELELKKRELFYRELIEKQGEGIAIVDKDENFVFFNPMAEKIFGEVKGGLIGKNLADYIENEGLELVSQQTRSRKQGVVSTYELPIVTADKKHCYIIVTATPQYDDRGIYTGAFGVFRDISSQKIAEERIKNMNAELEAKVKERTALLEATNKELESFSYSVSHDLRNPLRSIDGFTRILAEEYASGFDDEGRRILKVILKNVSKMGMLIDDLLGFARIGRHAIQKKPVDMNKLLDGVVEEVKAMFSTGKEIIIERKPLCNAFCDERLIRQVLSNLLNNAVKYSIPKNEIFIETGCQIVDGQCTYYIKDNGVGFDMKYYSKLFQVFHRLHKAEDFEGSGVGLAIVYQIIAKHGGKVWAESLENTGSVFYFTIPEINES